MRKTLHADPSSRCSGSVSRALSQINGSTLKPLPEFEPSFIIPRLILRQEYSLLYWTFSNNFRFVVHLISRIGICRVSTSRWWCLRRSDSNKCFAGCGLNFALIYCLCVAHESIRQSRSLNFYISDSQLIVELICLRQGIPRTMWLLASSIMATGGVLTVWLHNQ